MTDPLKILPKPSDEVLDFEIDVLYNYQDKDWNLQKLPWKLNPSCAWGNASQSIIVLSGNGEVATFALYSLIPKHAFHVLLRYYL